jgi:hypothetical protein
MHEQWHIGNIFLVDFVEHRIIEDTELKKRYTSAQPYQRWLEQSAFTMDDIITQYPRRRAANTLPSLEASMDEDNIIPILPSGEL